MDELVRPAPRRSITEHALALARWVGVGRIIAVLAAVVAVAAGAVWLAASPGGGAAQPATSGEPGASAPAPGLPTVPALDAVMASDPAVAPTVVVPSTAPTASSPSTVVVHVAGAVAAPGLYESPATERVGAAVTAAGGATAEAVLEAINLAAPLVDGQQVFVPRLGAASGPAAAGPVAAPSTTPLPVDINTASVDALLALPGIGPVTAAAIVRHRDEQGPFASVEQLLDVAGIGPARLASLAGLVRV